MTAQCMTAGAAAAMAAAGAAIETAAAQAPDDLYVLQVHYETLLEQETGAGAAAETIRETGTYHVSPDGRVRWDRRPAGEEALFEIHHPDGVRIVADPSRKRAIVRGPGFVSVVPPFSDGARRRRQSVGNLGVGPGQEALGTRVVEGLKLEGLRQVDAHAGFVAETWFYFPESVFTPILAEYRNGGGGTFQVQRITGVTNAYVPADRFAAQDDHARVESPNPRRRAVPR